MSNGPTQAEIDAVQKVLYKRARLQKLSDLSDSIVVLMNLNPAVDLPPDDVRNPPGSGPQWFDPATSAVDNSVLQAAAQCDELANTLLEMRHELADVSFPSDDKMELMGGLAAEAAAWSARSAAWKAPGPPGSPQATATAVSKHLTAALHAGHKVRHYLKRIDELGLT